ncbi:MAG: bifunctional hydroxymethylpyrimidine kinase/phosphomethylpyrimidine kinase (plasmid) [Pantoea sp. Brub]|nr:bifunctional hydroxymethylpyrimidine kinase/phosphomethylpyrimidine kinase [Pantoea sp. Brub]
MAGTDPSSGAGIQADLKTFSALGVYGTSVITSLLAQNTCGVQHIYPIKSSFVEKQIDSVLTDIEIDSIKIGFLYKTDIIRLVAKKIKEHNIRWIVLDTVMIFKNNKILLDDESINSLKKMLFPLASVITPNLYEASRILNCPEAKNENEMIHQGRKLLTFGCEAVIIKGGHLAGIFSPDWFISVNKEIRFSSPRINTINTHGTGCTLSAALAAVRPSCSSWVQTFKIVKKWLQSAILYSDKLNVGKGVGPLHHFYKWW